MFEVIDSGIRTASENMRRDEELLKGVDHPILHFYDWSSNAVTYGYFINPKDWLKSVPSNISRRPTGGGLIFHEGDFSFTLALPLKHPLTQKSALERYQIINKQVLNAVFDLLPECALALHNEAIKEGSIQELCMANPTSYDIIMAEKKVGGASQRKNKSAFIHQASLFLLTPSWERIWHELACPDAILPKLKSFTGSLFNSQDSIPVNFRADLKASLQHFLKNALN